MLDREVKIKAIAKKLLAENKVDIVIGHRKGTIAMKNIPSFAYDAQDVELLVWDGNCRSNLANLLSQYRNKRVAVVAQGCVSRNIVGLIQENQIKRENIYIIGVPCIGMIDPQKALTKASGEVLESKDDGKQILLKGRNFEIKIDRDSILRNNCSQCNHRNPSLCDELAGEEVKEQQVDNKYKDIEEIDAMSAMEKNRYFDSLFRNCIRCNACRESCPICYCNECFVDKSTPQWCGKSQDPNDIMSYHLIKAFHSAGRCTDCGACEDACPMGINLRQLVRRTNKDIYNNYNGFEPGLSLDAEPPMACFKLDDTEPFTTKE